MSRACFCSASRNREQMQMAPATKTTGVVKWVNPSSMGQNRGGTFDSLDKV
jgi:hypothetical protein